MESLKNIIDQFNNDTLSSELCVESAFQKIHSKNVEHHNHVFIDSFYEDSIQTAKSFDLLRRCNNVDFPLLGLLISVKGLFDLKGLETRAGSNQCIKLPIAENNAPVINRLRRAGAIIVGRTNMTEFAFSGVGINPHYGTPLNPYQRHIGRIPGGSSSGAAVSVTDNMAHAAIGTDTGGSVRIPAALCGLTGFKPTARRVVLTGTFPLSSTFDSIGPIAPTVACCELIDAIIADKPFNKRVIYPDLKAINFAIPDTLITQNMDQSVSRAFQQAINQLIKSGINIHTVRFDALQEIVKVNEDGGLVAALAYSMHKTSIHNFGRYYDPRVLNRISRGETLSADYYISLQKKRDLLIRKANQTTKYYDAILMPTVPIIAPKITDLTCDSDYYRINALLLRNTFIVNFLDRCAITIPIHRHGHAPVGLSLMGETMGDDKLFSLAKIVEHQLAPMRQNSQLHQLIQPITDSHNLKVSGITR